MDTAHYTFGTSAIAAGRLGEIAKFFTPLAADLIGRFVKKPVDTAVDLGCGPDRLTAKERADIGDEPAQLKAENGDDSNITWRLRKLVLRK